MKRSVFVGAKPTDKNRKKPLKTDKDDLSVYIPGDYKNDRQYFWAGMNELIGIFFPNLMTVLNSLINIF